MYWSHGPSGVSGARPAFGRDVQQRDAQNGANGDRRPAVLAGKILLDGAQNRNVRVSQHDTGEIQVVCEQAGDPDGQIGKFSLMVTHGRHCREVQRLPPETAQVSRNSQQG